MMCQHRNLLITTENPVVLLIIDPQLDFHDAYHRRNEDGTTELVYDKGSLAVTGATEDSLKIAKMIRENKDKIDEIFVTLDSHHKKHIAHAAFWCKNEDGTGDEYPEPFTQITNKNVQDGDWYPRDPSLKKHCLDYTKKLEQKKRFTLMIWPEHCLIGTVGHSIQPDILAALREWNIVHTDKTVKHIHKGMNCLTEMYSAIQAEVPIKTDTSTTRNTELLNELRKAKRLIVCGEAMSHCVKYTFEDVQKSWDQSKMSALYLLKDAASPVGGFEADASNFVADMEARGCTVTIAARAFDGL